MHLSRRVLILIMLITLSGLFIYLLVKPAFNYLSGYLSKSEPVNANILLVEGWLPYYSIELAYKEFIDKKTYDRIITTGLPVSEYFNVSMNGYLIFYTKNVITMNNDKSVHLIEIDAFSELEGEYASRFNVFINDSLKGNFEAGKRRGKYSINWIGNLTKIDSIMIQFVNDGYGDYGDKNLFVKEITIDKQYTIRYQKNSAYDIDELDGIRKISNNITSNAEIARNTLLSLGIDSSLILAIPGERVKINRTLTSALAFRDWLNTTHYKVNGINIVSMGTHSRRTWMTFRKVLNEKTDVGIISLPDYGISHSGKSNALKTFRETLGIIYYWCILLPY